MLRRTGIDVPEFDAVMRWNAHPPGAVLVALPFGLIPDYASAHLTWNLVTGPLFLASLIVVARELGYRWVWWTPYVAVVLILLSHPVEVQIGQGQLNFILLPLLVAGWVCDRRGYAAAAGAAIGLAATVKIFPGFLFVYFAAAGKWRAVAAGVVTAAAATGIAAVVLGTGAFATYLRDVVPSLNVFHTSWRNVSATGFWRRIFDPAGRETLATGLAVTSQLAVAVVTAATARTSRAVPDRGYAAACVGMLIASPVAWPHYFLLLLVPVAVLWVRLVPGPARWLFLLLLPIYWVRDTFFAEWVLGPIGGNDLTGLQDATSDPVAALTGLSIFTYALVLLFAVAVAGRFRPPPVARPVSVPYTH
jgi:hypothetical protein